MLEFDTFFNVNSFFSCCALVTIYRPCFPLERLNSIKFYFNLHNFKDNYSVYITRL